MAMATLLLKSHNDASAVYSLFLRVSQRVQVKLPQRKQNNKTPKRRKQFLHGKRTVTRNRINLPQHGL